MVDLGSTEIMSTLPDWLWNFSSSIRSLIYQTTASMVGYQQV
jgi:hypothetical protein